MAEQRQSEGGQSGSAEELCSVLNSLIAVTEAASESSMLQVLYVRHSLQLSDTATYLLTSTVQSKLHL